MSILHDREATSQERTGIPRFFGLLLDELGSLVKANLLCFCTLLPVAVISCMCLLFTRSVLLVFCAVLLVSPLVGKGLCGLTKVVNRVIRNETIPIHCGFSEPVRNVVLPGFLYLLCLELSAYMLFFRESINATRVSFQIWVLFFLGTAFMRLLFHYVTSLLVIMYLTPKQLLKNALLMIAAFPKQTALCLLLSTVVYGIEVLLLPNSLFFTALIGLAAESLAVQLVIWPKLNQTFLIKDRSRTGPTSQNMIRKDTKL